MIRLITYTRIINLTDFNNAILYQLKLENMVGAKRNPINVCKSEDLMSQ